MRRKPTHVEKLQAELIRAEEKYAKARTKVRYHQLQVEKARRKMREVASKLHCIKLRSGKAIITVFKEKKS